MPASKESIVTDLKTVSLSDQIWIVVEMGNDYIANQSIGDQRELVERLAVEGIDCAPFCRKNKDPETHA